MSKKELYDIISKLKKENEDLKEENAYLKFELQELKNKLYKRKDKEKPPPSPLLGESPAPKKKGGLFGHIGWFRRKLKRVDNIEEVRLDKCSECGSSNISECVGIQGHTQEDIVLPRLEVIVQRLCRK